MFSTQNCGQDFDEFISESEEQKMIEVHIWTKKNIHARRSYNNLQKNLPPQHRILCKPVASLFGMNLLQLKGKIGEKNAKHMLRNSEKN